MPMIELIVPEGAVPEDEKTPLMNDLTGILLRAERAPDTDITRAISWGYLYERPAARVFQGGQPVSAEEPTFRLKVTVPEGALNDKGKAELVAAAHERILQVAGEDAALRVWVMIDEVTDGNWGGAGRIFRYQDIVALATGAAAEAVATG
jgi:phenylpyruvate tautomerase PptA (4-oxalocrotonate tautomerase family)